MILPAIYVNILLSQKNKSHFLIVGTGRKDDPHSKFPPTVATKERMTKARLSLKPAKEHLLSRKVKRYRGRRWTEVKPLKSKPQS